MQFYKQKHTSINNLLFSQLLTNVRIYITPSSLPTLVKAFIAFSR